MSEEQSQDQAEQEQQEQTASLKDRVASARLDNIPELRQVLLEIVEELSK